jgi:hypothetical protein
MNSPEISDPSSVRFAFDQILSPVADLRWMIAFCEEKVEVYQKGREPDLLESSSREVIEEAGLEEERFLCLRPDLVGQETVEPECRVERQGFPETPNLA